MKPNGLQDENSSLSALLREWKVTAGLPPRFQERVWQRIASAEARAQGAPINRLGQWLAALQRALARPGLATACVAALLLAGFGAGWAQGLQTSAQLDQVLSDRYLQALDPYQHPRH